MLNKDGVRELAYLVRVDAITAMDADRLECAHVGGWKCVVGKGELKEGDVAVYFEIDSKLPEVAPFNEMEFLKSKHYAIKSQKIRGVVSQGLLMPVSAFGWEIKYGCFGWEPEGYAFFGDKVEGIEPEPYAVDKVNGKAYTVEGESRFFTKLLGVTYAISEDNARKAPSGDKYKAMAQRKPNVFKKKWARWMMKREWGRKVMFALFGRKRDKKNGWPAWVKKTDEERVQNLDYSALKGEKWFVTEKIDGTSTTFTLKKEWLGRRRFIVCSRNVAFVKEGQKCFYDTNVYTEMAEKYQMEKVLNGLLDSTKNLNFVTIQGETYGAGIQNRTYGLNGHDLKVFNVILGFKDGHVVRMNPEEGAQLMGTYGVPFVPVLEKNFELPETCDDLLAYADGKSVVDGGMREGCVFRSVDGQRSFKAVSNKYLLKYHC